MPSTSTSGGRADAVDVADVRAVALRVTALALLLLLVLFAVIAVRTLSRLPDATIYLIRSEPTSFTLEPVVRRLRADDPEEFARAAVRALAEGPTAAEAADGLSSAVPEDTRASSVRLEDGRLRVDLGTAFDAGGGTASMRGRLEQVRWTLTRPTGVTELALYMDGSPLEVLGGEGLMVPTRWNRPESGNLPRW